VNEPTTVSEMLSILQKTRQVWNAHISPLTDEQLLQPNVCGWWSVKDVIAHLYWYENQMVALLTYRSMEISSDWWNLPLDERNAIIEKYYKDVPLYEVISEEAATYGRLVELITAMRDEELHDASFFTDMPSDWSAGMLLDQNTWQHFTDHLVDIKAAFY